MKVTQSLVKTPDTPETVFLSSNKLECPVMKVRICGNWCHGGRHLSSRPIRRGALFRILAFSTFEPKLRGKMEYSIKY